MNNRNESFLGPSELFYAVPAVYQRRAVSVVHCGVEIAMQPSCRPLLLSTLDTAIACRVYDVRQHAAFRPSEGQRWRR
jgi:hypothetical protein